ncbi:MAG: hypothetical protein M3413_07540 [Bacteroidota bacterium]|nr:hypothetical protein [Bacteroidota bacterium]
MSNFISLEEAKALRSNFRRNRQKLPGTADAIPDSEIFSRDHIEKLLKQPGCTSLRIHFGMDDRDNLKLMITASNEKHEDLLEDKNASVLEDGLRCPPNCPPQSDLDS